MSRTAVKSPRLPEWWPGYLLGTLDLRSVNGPPLITHRYQNPAVLFTFGLTFCSLVGIAQFTFGIVTEEAE